MLVAAALAAGPAFSAELQRPRPGKVEIMKSSELKPGMKGVAWTVFQGTEAESIPVEIIGLWKNAWGPRQDTILAKLVWFRMGGEVSDQQWNDMVGVVRVQAGRLDMAYLRQWAAHLKVEDLLDRLFSGD